MHYIILAGNIACLLKQSDSYSLQVLWYSRLNMFVKSQLNSLQKAYKNIET
jgi:hypothetical protein